MTDKIRKVMAQIFEINSESINSGTSADTVQQWDSLKHMQLIMALEDELGIQFSDDSIPELLSFDAIEKAVKELAAI